METRKVRFLRQRNITYMIMSRKRSQLGIWYDWENNATTKKVGRSQIRNTWDLESLSPGGKYEWTFKLESLDIDFKWRTFAMIQQILIFISQSGVEGHQRQEIQSGCRYHTILRSVYVNFNFAVEKSRVASHSGEFKAKGPGLLTMIFDNSYSYLTSKNVHQDQNNVSLRNSL